MGECDRSSSYRSAALRSRGYAINSTERGQQIATVTLIFSFSKKVLSPFILETRQCLRVIEMLGNMAIKLLIKNLSLIEDQEVNGVNVTCLRILM